jgi:hypothetical protein
MPERPYHLTDAGRAAIARPRRARTHCPQGHPYAGANLYRWHNRRYCRTCCKARSVAQYQRLKEKRHAP